MFDTPGLRNPITSGMRGQTDNAPQEASSSQGPQQGRRERSQNVGQNVAESEVAAATLHREPDNNPAVWLEEDFEDDDDNLPYDAGLAAI